MTTQRKRRITRRLTTLSCQFPCEHFGHEFQYASSTRPPVYCPEHEKGYIDSEGHKHGGARLVRLVRDADGNVIARRLVVEEQVTHYGKVPTGAILADEARSTLRSILSGIGAVTLRALDRLHWKQVEQVKGPGVVATTSTLVTGRNGDPRVEPGYYRSVTVDQSVIEPFGLPGQPTVSGLYEVPLSPSERKSMSDIKSVAQVEAASAGRDSKSERRSGEVLDPDDVAESGSWANLTAEDVADQQYAPAGLHQTYGKGIIPDARRRFEVAFGKLWVYRHDPARWWERRQLRRMQASEPALFAELTALLSDAHMSAAMKEAAGVSAVQKSEGSKSRHEQENQS